MANFYVHLSADPSIDLCVCLCISWLVPLSVFPSVSLFIHLSIRLSIASHAFLRYCGYWPEFL